MEYGFWHPVVGYFQLLAPPTLTDMASFPAGTISVPLRPSGEHEWVNDEWVHVKPAPTLTRFQHVTSDFIETAAKSKGYDSSVSCVSYRGSNHPIWSSEAETFFQWRDSVWIETFRLLGEVQAGNMEIPDVDTFTTLLPQIVW